jgi:hypothetical protein
MITGRDEVFCLKPSTDQDHFHCGGGWFSGFHSKLPISGNLKQARIAFNG